MFGFLKKKEVFLCPVDGKILPISEVNDPVFSQEMMGPGFAVVPSSKVIVAPMDGDVVTVFPTSHAFGIKSKNGIEMIIHIGIDTVELNGKGFKPLVKQGDVVKAGYDLENIKDDGGNESTQTITVTLPKASIFDFYLDEKSYVQYWEGEKITANVGLDDIHKEKKRMLKEAKQDAIKGGLYEKTAEHAKVVITDYIHSLKGYENYNVVFNDKV